MKVLIVDDEQKVRSHLRELIVETDGFEIAGEASDGEEALLFCERSCPDIIITDIRMPRMDGLTMLRGLAQNGHRPGRIILSGYGDFYYTQAAMQHGIRNYLLKPIEKDALQRALQQAVEEIRQSTELNKEISLGRLARKQQALNQLIHGYHPADEPALEDVMPFFRQHGVLFAIETVSDDDSDPSDRLNQLQDEKRVFITGGMNRIICFSTYEEDPVIQAEELVSILSGKDKASVFIACSDPINSDDGILPAYRSADRLLDDRWLLGGRKVLTAGMLPDISSRFNLEEIMQYDPASLDNAIVRHDSEEIGRQVDLLFRTLPKIAGTPSLMQSFLLEGMIRSMRIVLDKGGDAGMVLTGPLDFRDFIDLKQIDEIKKRYTDFCRSVSEYLYTLSIIRPEKLSERVLSLLKENPSRNCSLDELGKIFFMSPVYLSHLFKQETGETLHSWIICRKVEMANELLLGTDKPVYEIAEYLGYQNLRSFYSAYKKIENCTPSEYRERNRKT